MPHKATFTLSRSLITVSDPTGQLTYRERFGTANAPVGCVSFSDGVGSGEANVTYRTNFSIAANGTLSVDLHGGNGELDCINKPLHLASVKAVMVELDTPGTGNEITFGPAGVANGCPLWFANDATQSMGVRDTLFQADSIGGWVVSNTTRIVPLHNAGNATLTGELRITGVGS